MPKKRKQEEGYFSGDGFQLPPPHDHLYLGHTKEEDQMLDALMQAGETLATPIQKKERLELLGDYAEPTAEIQTPYPTDFTGLTEIIERIRDLAATDARLMALLQDMPRIFGNGEGLKVLFRRLFPDQQKILQTPDDKQSQLTPREVAVLREMSSGLLRKEVAERLGISESALNSHLDNIYRKLGVSRPIQAVARAVAKGYLEMDSLTFIREANNCNIGDFEGVGALLIHAPDVNSWPQLAPLAQFGLLLLALTAPMRYCLGSDNREGTDYQGVLYEIAPKGEVSEFGGGHLYKPRCLITVPLNASAQGFTPGHLLVAHGEAPQLGINTGGIVQFTPARQFAGAFCGAKSVALRLENIGGLCFAPDGRLLVSSGWLTDGLLAFSDGGRKIERFANGAFCHISTGPDERIYAAQTSSAGSIVKIFDNSGRLIGAVGGTEAGIRYYGLAVSESGRIYASRFSDHANHNAGEGVIAVFNSDGSPLREFTVKGLRSSGQIAVDAQNRLYVACENTRDVKVVSPEGQVKQRIVLPCNGVPYGVAIGAKDRLWVCGMRQQ